VLQGFYAGQTPLSVRSSEYRHDYLQNVEANGRELLATTHHLSRTEILRAQSFQLQLLRMQPLLFDERVRRECIYDGHGDLRPEHICFAEPITIFDCIEFNEHLRRLDVADEFAFLAAECDFIGAAWVGQRLWQRHLEASEHLCPQILYDFYRCYRACVRAKVAALRADQLSGTAKERSIAEAGAHLNFANRYAAPHQKSVLIVVGGLPGTGKSTIAKGLADALGAEWLRTYIIRKELFEREMQTTADIYQPAQRQRVYDEMANRAQRLQEAGLSLMLDGTFSNAENIDSTRGLLHSSKGPALYVECQCRPFVALSRIRQRQDLGADPSEATLEVYEQQQEQWEQWPALLPQLRVDTEQPLEVQIAAVISRLALSYDS
jgi:predicted kinase